MAQMLREEGAMVTVAHSEVNKAVFKDLVGKSDVVVTCAGSPGAIQASWLKDEAEVINVGTTFCVESDSLVSDVEGDMSAKASRYSPVPGGVGPLSLPMLFQNVVNAAFDHEESKSEWKQEPAKLR